MKAGLWRISSGISTHFTHHLHPARADKSSLALRKGPIHGAKDVLVKTQTTRALKCDSLDCRAALLGS